MEGFVDERSRVGRRINLLRSHLASNIHLDEEVIEKQLDLLDTAGFGASWLYVYGGGKATWNVWKADHMSSYSFSSLFEDCVKNHPNNVAIVFEDRKYTYSQVHEITNRVGHWARNIGLKPNDIVALMMENRPEFLWTWLGLCKIGCAIAFINFRLHGSSLQHVLKISEAKAYIVGSELTETFASVFSHPQVYVYKGIHGEQVNYQIVNEIQAKLLDEELGSAVVSSSPVSIDLRGSRDVNSSLWLIYTSGTTGLPKAAKVTQRNILARTTILANMLQIVESDKIYCCLPLYHSSGSTISLTAWHTGAAVVIRRNFSSKEFFNDCRKYDCTVFLYIGELCRYLLATPPNPELDKKHKIRLGVGNGLRPDVWEKFVNRFAIPQIAEFYGSTEGSSLINVTNKSGAVGYFPWFIQFANPSKLIEYNVEADTLVRDSRGFCVPCKPGVPGELISKLESDPTSAVTGGGMFSGYTDKQATEKKILRDVFEKGDMWFRSGDLLRVDEEGYYYFVDRIGDTFRWKGENVSTNEVAEVMSLIDSFEEVTVYGVSVHGYEGRCGMASVVLQSGRTPQNVDWDFVYQHLEKDLPHYAQPVFIRIQADIAKTSTFKYQKTQLVQESFDLDKVSDPIFFRQAKARTYVRLDRQLYNQIIGGQLKL